MGVSSKRLVVGKQEKNRKGLGHRCVTQDYQLRVTPTASLLDQLLCHVLVGF